MTENIKRKRLIRSKRGALTRTSKRHVGYAAEEIEITRDVKSLIKGGMNSRISSTDID